MKHAQRVIKTLTYRTAKESNAPGYLARRFQEIRKQQKAAEEERQKKVRKLA